MQASIISSLWDDQQDWQEKLKIHFITSGFQSITATSTASEYIYIYIYIYNYFLRFIKKIEYHHLILSLRHFVNLSNTKWIQSKSFPLNTNYDHYANIKGAAHINNSKLKHKAYEDVDTIITMLSI